MRGKVIRRCKVRGCINNLKSNPNVALFRVPNNNTEVLEKWVQECGDTDYLEVPMKYLKDNLKMCSAHFLPDQIKRTALLTRLKEPVAPTIFEGCVGRQPFTDEQIVAWRRTKQYGANYDATLEKKKAQKEQLSHILKEALAGEDSASSIESEFMKEPLGEDDLASMIGSECTFSTSTEGSAEQASHEWAPSNLVLQIGNRLVAIPALSIPIPGME